MTQAVKSAQPDSLAGKVGLVVGAAGGIGAACAARLAGLGAVVAAADIAQPAPGIGDSVHACDVTDADAIARLVTDVVELHGGLDIAVVTAGALHVAPCLETAPADWDRIFAVNTRGSFLVAQAAAAQMVRAQSGGRIVCFSSIVSRIARPNNVAYCASKAAIAQMVRCMALELAPHGITVNAVGPGSTRTGMLLGEQMASFGDEAEAAVVRGDLSGWRLGIPLGRMAEPDDQAAVVAFLASEAAKHVTGQELMVDGGQSIV